MLAVARYWPKRFTNINSFNLYNNPKRLSTMSIITLILQTRKPRHREVKWLPKVTQPVTFTEPVSYLLPYHAAPFSAELWFLILTCPLTNSCECWEGMGSRAQSSPTGRSSISKPQSLKIPIIRWKLAWPSDGSWQLSVLFKKQALLYVQCLRSANYLQEVSFFETENQTYSLGGLYFPLHSFLLSLTPSYLCQAAQVGLVQGEGGADRGRSVSSESAIQLPPTREVTPQT